MTSTSAGQAALLTFGVDAGTIRLRRALPADLPAVVEWALGEA
ncbi:hypothetical protein ACTWLI_06585 [Arthrobacter sp. Hor0625]